MLNNLEQLCFVLLVCFKIDLFVNCQNPIYYKQYGNVEIPPSIQYQGQPGIQPVQYAPSGGYAAHYKVNADQYDGNQLKQPNPPRFHRQVPPLPPGWCFLEVPTHTLHKNTTYLAPGNGSHPSLSVIQTCCEGYYRRKINNEDVCIPVCDKKKCVNAFCVAPNECNCFPDHVKGFAGHCFPTCPIGCVNGKCNFDGECTCNDGYIFDSSRKFCRPYCSQNCGELKNCSAPGICSCLNGYALDSTNGCQPICTENCLNGMCVGPDTCLCYTGFFLIDNVCQATCWQNCTNGKCVSQDTCICNPGYVTYMDSCIPFCTDCQHGTCIEPQNCNCDEGYKKVNGKCKPHCKHACTHGDCIAPDVCHCYPKYEKNALGRCVKRHNH